MNQAKNEYFKNKINNKIFCNNLETLSWIISGSGNMHFKKNK